MSRKSPNIIVSSTDHHSAIADAIVALVDNPKITKNAVLNIISAELLGKKVNWGGLKSLPSPVFAKGLSAEALNQPIETSEEEPDGSKYWLRDGVIFFNFHQVGGDTPIAIRPTEVPMLEAAILKDYEYANGDLSFRNDGSNLRVSARMLNESPDITFNCETFLLFLDEHRHTLLNSIATDDFGKSVKDAFTDTVKGHQEEMILSALKQFPEIATGVMQESDALRSGRVAAAIREATWSWFAAGKEEWTRRMLILSNGRDECRNDLFAAIRDHGFDQIQGEISALLLQTAKDPSTYSVSIPATVSPDAYKSGIVTRSVLDLRPGDRVDLENDLYADPYDPDGEGTPALQHEFQVVESIEMETPGCVLVHFESWPSCGFPPDHRVSVDPEQVLPVYMFKNRESVDDIGRSEFLTLTRAGDEHERLYAKPDEARAYASQHRLEIISPARLFAVRRESGAAKAIT